MNYKRNRRKSKLKKTKPKVYYKKYSKSKFKKRSNLKVNDYYPYTNLLSITKLIKQTNKKKHNKIR